MDDLLMARLLLMTNPILLRNIIESIDDVSCDLCEREVRNKKLIECIFCNKSFCKLCTGRENTRICKNCNFMLATTVSQRVLQKFSVKELRVITDNYHVSLENVLEKEQLIDAILINFKKSIKSIAEPVVNVSELTEKMKYLKIEEKLTKEKLLEEEKNRSQIFSDYSKISNEKLDLEVNFTDNQSFNVSEKDIPQMSIRKLKDFLDYFKIDYSTILEKQELISLAITLHKKYTMFQRNQIQNSPRIVKELECNICMDNNISCVFIECGHSTCCYDCGIMLNNCPLCRREVKKCLKVIIG